MERGEYTLVHGDVLTKLSEREFFIKSMTANFNAVARRVGCQVSMNRRRLVETHDYWLADAARTLNNGIRRPTKELDHFKHASFIAFWLRRTVPIETFEVITGWEDDPHHDRYKRRSLFLRFGNEICALRVGYQICLNYEAATIFSDESETVVPLGNRLAYFRSRSFPDALMEDFATIMKHKTMSPYAVYMTYKSLFNRRTGSDF